mmetsp:Transcript_25005/g.39525  ORF Transcript_25005/g.39525 Transcript_25005/m.39525 type:complete len:344 (-) Transcript_25005:268-1299(-)
MDINNEAKKSTNLTNTADSKSTPSVKPASEDPNPKDSKGEDGDGKANKGPRSAADSGRSEEKSNPKAGQGSSFTKQLKVEVLGSTAERFQELIDKIEAITRKHVLEKETKKKIVETLGLLHNAKVKLSQFAIKLKAVVISLAAVVKKRSLKSLSIDELARLASKINQKARIQESAEIMKMLKKVQEEVIDIQQDLKSAKKELDIQSWSNYLLSIASSVTTIGLSVGILGFLTPKKHAVKVMLTTTVAAFNMVNGVVFKANGVENKRKATIEAYDRAIDHLDQVYKEAAEANVLVNNIRAGLDPVQVALYVSQNGWELKSEPKEELKESLENILNICNKIVREA